ncbi:MAG: (d)CMP kinase, partial [Butyricicoccus pullicaecorum]|nr:(d)CMP kinase [Butyricicoccus pullicaecorum]
GPDKDGGYGPYVQSERMKTGIYMKYAKELIEKGQQVTMDGILHDINERDRQDMTRAVAPLKQADDAVLLDTSSLTLEESIAAVLRIIREKTEEKA